VALAHRAARAAANVFQVRKTNHGWSMPIEKLITKVAYRPYNEGYIMDKSLLKIPDEIKRDWLLFARRQRNFIRFIGHESISVIPSV
jgi:hypothetical protein